MFIRHYLADTPDEAFGNKEERRVILGLETRVARVLGEIDKSENTRSDHNGWKFETLGPTSTTGVYEVKITEKNEK